MAKRRKNRLEKDILESIESALGYLKGRRTKERTHIIDAPDVQAIRKNLRLSQARFAQRFGIPKRTVQDWEQGRRLPDQAARSFLKVIAQSPETVRRALAP